MWLQPLLCSLLVFGLAAHAKAAVDEQRYLPPPRAIEVAFDGVGEALVGGNILVLRRDDGGLEEVRLLGVAAHVGVDPGRALVEGRRVRLFADPSRRDRAGRLMSHGEHLEGESLAVAIALARAGRALPARP